MSELICELQAGLLTCRTRRMPELVVAAATAGLRRRRDGGEDVAGSAARSPALRFRPVALAEIQRTGVGVMVFLNCSRSDEALQAQLAGAPPPRQGRSMDLRTYGIGAQILRDLGVGKMRLMATPRKMPSMAGFGLEVTGYAERDVK